MFQITLKSVHIVVICSLPTEMHLQERKLDLTFIVMYCTKKAEQKVPVIDVAGLISILVWE